MDSIGHPAEEDGQDTVRETMCKGKTKQRHKFTQEELERLNEIFQENPYPDFSTREKLAKQFNCEIFVIYTWFQNKRARLPQEERQRMFTTWKQQNDSETENLPLNLQNTQAAYSNTTTEQGYCTQKILVGGAASYPLERDGVQSCFLSSGETGGPERPMPVALGNNSEEVTAFMYQGYTGCEPSACSFLSYNSPTHVYGTSSMQYHDRDWAGAGESQHETNPLHLLYACYLQQEEQKAQELNDWLYYGKGSSQPQPYQEEIQRQLQEELSKDLSD